MTPTQLLFQDWGQTAVLRETVPYYDPDTGQMEESESESTIQIVPGLQTRLPLAPTAAAVDHATHSFLMQSSDLPETLSLQNTHLVLEGRLYAVIETNGSPISNLTVLQCTDVTCSTSS